MKKFLVIILLLCLVLGLYSFCISSHPKSLCVAFYNVENLFDTINDPHRNDNEFLPQSSREWNGDRYRTKLLNVSRVILGMNNWEGPDVIGLCEVENRTVLQDLISNTALESKGYEIIHRNSPDPRGIDVALLYKKNNVELLSYAYFPILKENEVVKTREILLVSTKYKKDTLHFFVNHWSSRRGGEKQSEHKRINAALLVKQKVDSLLTINKEAKIIIMGDFNDDPDNESIQTLLSVGLNNVTQKPDGEIGGTLKYQGKWNLFDQLIISEGLKNECKRACYLENSYTVFAPDWMLTKDSRYSGMEPLRTFKGKNYLAGYSDHFPVSITISK